MPNPNPYPNPHPHPNPAPILSYLSANLGWRSPPVSNARPNAGPAKVRPEWRRAGFTSARGCPGWHLGAASLSQPNPPLGPWWPADSRAVARAVVRTGACASSA
eukprot:scaffold94464_cov42-Phaeocystis_antarctica.AAC.2